MFNGILKIFNFKKKKVIFEKTSPSGNGSNLGVLAYQWLSDRSTLLYFYADKSSKQSGNAQNTELYSLELPSSDEDTPPDNRLNKTIANFPAGGKIEEFVISTSTNLMYFTVKNGSTEQLMEINVMKSVRTLSKSGETIDKMAASDLYGTLYIDSKLGSTQTIIAFDAEKRKLISRNAYDKFIELSKANNLDIIINVAFRSWDDQDELYAQGRTIPGNIVTNARGGESYHNWGLAFDASPLENGKISNNINKFMTMGKLGEQVGLEWGGSFKSIVDYPHFQVTFGLNTEDLLNGKRPPK